MSEEILEPVRILLVDDSEEFRRSASLYLSSDPACDVVGAARSGLEALEEIPRLRPDLVLVDLVMPGLSGLDVIRRVKAIPDAPLVVVVTLYVHSAYRAAALSCGADGFVGKAAFAEEIFGVVRDVRRARSERRPLDAPA